MPGRRPDARIALRTHYGTAGASRRAGAVHDRRTGVDPALVCLVTCEHGGNCIPAAYASFFTGYARLLDTHRGYDPGALSMARTLARMLGATLVTSTVSRLLVELNRSPGRQFAQSPAMRGAPRAVRDDVCRRYYVPYRKEVEEFIARAIGAGRRVLHVSSHSFAPMLAGSVRTGDIGLLYDPRRQSERALCSRWQAALRRRIPRWIARRNYPYLGVSDGFTTWLRNRFPEPAYMGIELEINQKRIRNRTTVPTREGTAIVLALREALEETSSSQAALEKRQRA